MGCKTQYTAAYKCKAVANAKTIGNVSQTARELGISNKSLREWIKQFGEAVVSENLVNAPVSAYTALR